MNWRHAAAALALLAAGCASAAPSLAPLADWEADSRLAARAGRPLVLFFTLPGCRFCEDVRQRYMLPLVRQGQLVREVVIGSAQPVAGLADANAQDGVARKFGVRFAPVVLLVDGQARKLADPIMGGDTAGLYGGYLDNAFEQAQRTLGRQVD
ncbi:thioredoxin fold domain-containing protein [Massilia solisilvae]|uniref:Thioredoxin fold domain-containing protein n=1 Tax=Massilia solisilvae TaxID=1811225 RepID=A0ABT2BGL8_9BURK|nr:thioredoxin fold domain-containing protein [Massilia solisilvae]MCS0607660.1 thioredoxin fold domain-containing protein [Massilia solisilvae]